MADHVSGLLLTARSEVQLILRELPSMVRLLVLDMPQLYFVLKLMQSAGGIV